MKTKITNDKEIKAKKKRSNKKTEVKDYEAMLLDMVKAEISDKRGV